ncbi:MAG: PAS domain-containing sensor histidine kinase [Bacteroidetes bacterium]|nr:PAS domain-containing sensor histidine kinase [Bacteroidota bacterium]
MKKSAFQALRALKPTVTSVFLFFLGTFVALIGADIFPILPIVGVDLTLFGSSDLVNELMMVGLVYGLLWIGTYRKPKKSTQITSKSTDDEIILLFSESIRTTSDGLGLTDASGTFVWVNQGFANLTGYSIDEIVGNNPRLFKSGKHGQEFYKRLWSTVLSGHIFRGEVFNKRKDGTFYTGEVTITPIQNAAGEISHFSVMERDISRRIEREEALKQGNDKFRTLVETMNDGLAMFDVDDHITYANPVFLSKLGYSCAEIVGSSIDNMLDAKNQAIVAKQSTERRKNKRQHYDLEMITKAGTRKLFAISPSGRYDSKGEFIGSFAIFREVSVEREIEDRLKEAKEKAESVSLFKSSLLDNVNHELRTPLTGIIGFADLLAESATENQQEMVSLIQSEGLRLLSTLTAVLDMSTVLSENMVTNNQPCHLTAEALQSVRKWKSMAKDKKIGLRVESFLKDSNVEMDKTCLEQVFNHLIGNAVKFTERGEVIVELRDSKIDPALVEIVVRDTGIGIEEAAQGIIFNSFAQESRGMNRSHNGLGLGLSFTKLLVEQMGGSITVTSLKHIGSEFVVTLPRNPAKKGLGSPSADTLLGDPIQRTSSDSATLRRIPVRNGQQARKTDGPVKLSTS